MRAKALTTIILSLILGFFLDSFFTSLINETYFEISLTYLIFFYWCYAAPQQFSLLLIIATGLILDFVSAFFLGTYTLSFILFSFIIRSYAFRLRLFSHLQISLIFILLSSIGFTLKYQFIYPDGYFYSKLIFNFLSILILWPLVFGFCRYLRKRYAPDIR